MVELERISSRGISHSDRQLLVLLPTRTYVLILERDQLFYTSQDQSFRILFPIRSSPNCFCAHCPYICPCALALPHNRLFTFRRSTLGQSALARSARDQTACDQTRASSIHTEHPSSLEVVVIGDQLTYFEVALLH